VPRRLLFPAAAAAAAAVAAASPSALLFHPAVSVSPSCDVSQLRTVRALSMVSAVVKVLLITTAMVSSGSSPLRARACNRATQQGERGGTGGWKEGVERGGLDRESLYCWVMGVMR